MVTEAKSAVRLAPAPGKVNARGCLLLVATVANHALAASVGGGMARAIPPRMLTVGVALGS